MESLYIQFTNAKEREDFLCQLLGGDKEPLAIEAVETLKARSYWQDPKVYGDNWQNVTCTNFLRNKGVRFIKLLNSLEGKVGNWVVLSLDYKAKALRRKIFQLCKGHIHTSDEVSENCLLEQLQTAFLAEDLNEANETMLAIYRQNPWFFKNKENVNYGLKLAEMYLREGDLTKALGWYDFLIREDPDNPLVYLGLGSVYMMAGDIESSLDCFLEGLERNPGHDLLCYNSCLLLQGLGETDLAIEETVIALENNPESPLLHKLAGDLALNCTGMLEEALEHYKKAIFCINEEDSQELLIQLLNNYGLALAQNGETLIGEKVLLESLNIDDSREDTLLNLSAFYGFFLEDHDMAIDCAKKVLNINPDSGKAYHNLGLASLAKGDWEIARWYLYKAKKLLPKDYAPLNNALIDLQEKRPKS